MIAQHCDSSEISDIQIQQLHRHSAVVCCVWRLILQLVQAPRARAAVEEQQRHSSACSAVARVYL